MTGELLLTGGRVVTPHGVLDGGSVLVRDGLIRAVLPAGAGASQPGPAGGSVTDAGGHPGGSVTDAGDETERVDLAGRYLLPGFVDLHVHGAAGAAFDDGAEAIATAVAAHRARGTTRTLLSLITASPAD
ncbi:MAG TPA: hypothetical protein VFM01_18945, partial [Nakamurella sp.]|nr:hypothetical protein [Nakamurella sp.]